MVHPQALALGARCDQRREFAQAVRQCGGRRARLGLIRAELAKTSAEMADMKRMMNHPIYGPAMVFIEPFPVGVLVTLISAAVLRKKPA